MYISLQDCEGVVFGIEGGRDYWVCETYYEIDPMMDPVYSPHLNVHVRRRAMDCMLDCEFGFDKVYRVLHKYQNLKKNRKKVSFTENRMKLF